MGTLYRLFRSGVLTLAAVVGSVSILLFVVSMLFGIKPLTVVSGSMEPAIPVGGLIFSVPTDASEIREGDIVTTNRASDAGLITHRVVSIVPSADDSGVYEMRLKGDANEFEDPDPYLVEEVGKYLFHVPFLGTIVSVLQSSVGVYAGVAFASLLILLFLFPGTPARSDDDQLEAKDNEPEAKDNEPGGEERKGEDPVSDPEVEDVEPAAEPVPEVPDTEATPAGPNTPHERPARHARHGRHA